MDDNDSGASRKLTDLTPTMRACANLFLDLAQEAKLDVLIYCTRRSLTAQARLFRQGRTLALIESRARVLANRYARRDLAELLLGVGPQFGRLVTHAAPGQSLHNYGMAFDAVPMRAGKPVWTTKTEMDQKLWALYGHLVKQAGLEWSGDWLQFRELPHAQLPGVMWADLIKHESPFGGNGAPV